MVAAAPARRGAAAITAVASILALNVSGPNLTTSPSLQVCVLFDFYFIDERAIGAAKVFEQHLFAFDDERTVFLTDHGAGGTEMTFM